MKMASPKSLPFSPAVCGHWAPSVFRHLNSALTAEFISVVFIIYRENVFLTFNLEIL